MGWLGDLLVMKLKHVIWKKNVVQVVEVASFGSSLMASKNKREGDGSVTLFKVLVMQIRYREVSDYFSCLWRTKSYSVGRTNLGGSRETHMTKRAYGSSKIRVIRMISNQDESIDVAILIAMMWKVHWSKPIWGKMSQSKFLSKLGCGLGVSFLQLDQSWRMKPSSEKVVNLLDR